jgi:hypothetical protein
MAARRQISNSALPEFAGPRRRRGRSRRAAGYAIFMGQRMNFPAAGQRLLSIGKR